MHLVGPLEDLAREAGHIAASARANLKREIKPDGSVVTNADREVELFLREALVKLVPNTTVWGEEFGHAEPGSAGLWLVDPVDGTTNFATGSPQWGVSIALAVGDEIRLGAVALPDYGEVWIGGIGRGVSVNGKKLAAIEGGPIARH
ncbi:MAG: inositol monophosphatase family protein, partial [Fimbriimonadaceae bacterium]